MEIWRAAVAASVASLWLAGCAPLQGMSSLQGHMMPGPTTQQDLADAADGTVWGVYAGLPGRTLSSARDGGTDITWRWIKPGRVMQEIWHATGQPSPIKIVTLWRGDEPGVLHAETTGLRSQAWNGRVQPDGSVLFAGAAPQSTPFRAALGNDGALELRGAEVRNGALVALGGPQATDRYVANAGLPLNTARARASGSPAAPAAATPRASMTGTASPAPARATLSSSASTTLPSAAASARPSAATIAPSGARTAAAASPRAAALPDSLDGAPATTTRADSGQAAVAQADADVARAEAGLQAARQALAQAKAGAEKADSSMKMLASVEASTRPVPKGRGKLGDFWTYCVYTALSHRGEQIQTFVTNLINERMWEEAYPRTPEAIAEFEAYDGPNTPLRVARRFVKAMQTSGILPKHAATSRACSTAVSYNLARRQYERWKHEKPQPTYVVWNSLQDEHLQGSLRLPTPEEAAEIKREAEEAARQLKAAQAAAKREEDLLARRKEAAQRARACAAGDARACAARGTKN